MTKSWVPNSHRIVALATQGSGGDDEARLRELLRELSPSWISFSRDSKKAKIKSFIQVLFRLRRDRPDLVVMEGSGIGGGLALLIARALFGIPYVVSTGDAIGPFVSSQRKGLGGLFHWYEKRLYRHSSGIIGWTPYLAGRALTYGAPRAMCAPGWAPSALSREQRQTARIQQRKKLGISEDAIVIGIAGSLAWNPRKRYCYGYELVDAIRRCSRQDIHALIIGDGAGREILVRRAENELGKRIHLPGRVRREEIPSLLAVMDLASLPQSCDQVGSFRYSTKLSEYLAAGLPVVMGEVPMAYDLDEGWLWRIAGDAPWEERYTLGLASLLSSLTKEQIEQKRALVPENLPDFDRERQVRRVTLFIEDLLRHSKRRSEPD
jgi:glycosyltransferase involved in cell wall biosynthesis